MEYMQILNNIALIINDNNPHKDNKQIVALLQELKNSYGVILSYKFLSGLIENATAEQKHLKIKHLVKSLNLNIDLTFRDYTELGTIKKQIEQPIYCYDKVGAVMLKELKVLNVGIFKKQYKRETIKLIC